MPRVRSQVMHQMAVFCGDASTTVADTYIDTASDACIIKDHIASDIYCSHSQLLELAAKGKGDELVKLMQRGASVRPTNWRKRFWV